MGDNPIIYSMRCGRKICFGCRLLRSGKSLAGLHQLVNLFNYAVGILIILYDFNISNASYSNASYSYMTKLYQGLPSWQLLCLRLNVTQYLMISGDCYRGIDECSFPRSVRNSCHKTLLVLAVHCCGWEH